MADDATERLLKEQARAHGLDAYAPEPEGVAPKTIAYAIRQDAERDEAALRFKCYDESIYPTISTG